VGRRGKGKRKSETAVEHVTQPMEAGSLIDTDAPVESDNGLYLLGLELEQQALLTNA